jgi:uncharacterized protein YndB with AHSA1/START domain
MPYTFTLTTVIDAPPQAIYDAWLDSRGHSAMTGSKAAQSAKAGASITAWNGYITGKNVRLVPGKLIVQTWRTTKFTDAHGDSTITVDLAPANGGTCLTLTHADVPDGQTSYEEGGWRKSYFEPMQRYFARSGRKAAAKKRPAARKAAKKKAARKKLAKNAAPRRAAKKSKRRTVKRGRAKR